MSAPTRRYAVAALVPGLGPGSRLGLGLGLAKYDGGGGRGGGGRGGGGRGGGAPCMMMSLSPARRTHARLVKLWVRARATVRVRVRVGLRVGPFVARATGPRPRHGAAEAEAPPRSSPSRHGSRHTWEVRVRLSHGRGAQPSRAAKAAAAAAKEPGEQAGRRTAAQLRSHHRPPLRQRRAARRAESSMGGSVSVPSLGRDRRGGSARIQGAARCWNSPRSESRRNRGPARSQRPNQRAGGGSV